MESPIKEIRLKENKTLEQVAHAAEIHESAVYLAEQGVHVTLLPALSNLFKQWGYNLIILRDDYLEFQRTKRKTAGSEYYLDEWDSTSLGPPVENEAPLTTFRKRLNLSKMGFCKIFCIHPSSMYRMEQGDMVKLSDQMRVALNQAGLPENILHEIEIRTEDFYYSIH